MKCVLPIVLMVTVSIAYSGGHQQSELATVRAYADAMIQKGRDVYGAEHSPLFAAALDRHTLRLPESLPPAIEGIREGDRSISGANPMHDENLYQVLYALSTLTGDSRYATEADAALQWFFQHTLNATTGFPAWGEHLSWDFRTEKAAMPMTKRSPLYDYHEFYRPWVLCARSAALAPEAFQRFAMAVWQHQIADQKTGGFNRHTRYTQHGPGDPNREFPRHGGFYIGVWAAAYKQSHDPQFLHAIETLAAYFDAHRNPQSGAIPANSYSSELTWPQSELSLAIDLSDAAQALPVELAAKLRAIAQKTDSVFLKEKHDLGSSGRGFITTAGSASLQPVEGKGNRPFTDTWSTGYGESTDADVAMLCLLRYKQRPLDGFRKLFIATADRYVAQPPNPDLTIYPGSVGGAILVLTNAWRIAHDAKYLASATALANSAQRMFFDGSPLPRASTRHDHYEAITRGDTLVLALLDLWIAKHPSNKTVDLIWTDR
jgi:hypothetical protein